MMRIASTKVLDAGLEYLDFYSANVTDTGVRKFQQALPIRKIRY